MASNNTKIWIGNIDSKLSEYQLLKLIESAVSDSGQIDSFDFLYTMCAKGSRVPRGYAFVTVSTRAAAGLVIKQLNKMVINGRVSIFRKFYL